MGDEGYVGLEQWSSTRQSMRDNANAMDSLIGRNPTLPPAYLSRILYVPRHDNSTPHLPLYDVSDLYRKTVGDTPMGSSMYTVKVSGMKKPAGDGTDGNVGYLVDFKRDSAGEDVVATVQKRAGGTVREGNVRM
jgi:hypothetical protein